MGIPKFYKLLQMIYIDNLDKNNKHYKVNIFNLLSDKDNIDLFFDFNSLIYLINDTEKNFEQKLVNFLNNNIFINLKNKNYTSHIFIDGIPSYNKILN